MDVSRDELERLIAEALIRDPTFCPKRRDWAQAAAHNELRARICAAAIVTFLHDCGVRWSRLPPAPAHRTPGEYSPQPAEDGRVDEGGKRDEDARFIPNAST